MHFVYEENKVEYRLPVANGFPDMLYLSQHRMAVIL